MNKMFHVFSEGENVLFRDDSDYVFFNNRFASSSHSLQLQPLAESTLSTHFHSVTDPVDESVVEDFIFQLRKAYGIYYASKYGYSLGNALRISKVEITSKESALNELLYVMKNPVHHYVAQYPFEYPYSSVSYVFPDKLIPPQYRSAFQSRVTTVGNLNYRQRRLVEGSAHIPDNWEVLDNNMILPSSYINILRVRAFWSNSVRSFMYNINQTLKDAKKEVISSDVLDLRTSGLNDISVCKIIDDFSKKAGKKSFHQLQPQERQTLIRILKQNAVQQEQAERCLWL